MLFFSLLALLAVLAWGLRVPGWPARMRIAMAAALFFVGADHVGAPPPRGGLGLLVPRLRRLAGLPQAQWYYWVRLAFQPPAIWWALFSAELTRWPFNKQLAVQS